MVDVDHRVSSRAHSAGLRRLSARAHAGSATQSSGGRPVFSSFTAYGRTTIDHLRNCQVPVEKGLSDDEFARVEAAYGLTFPPDLKAILQEGLPVGVEFPNWRQGSCNEVQVQLDLPCAGLLYEVARENLWWKQWGPRPTDTEQAVRVALKAIQKAPILVPVYRHCYVSSSPNLAGNPVFFVFGQDVFICGIDVADFFKRNEFTPHDYEPPTNLTESMKWIEDRGSKVTSVGSGRPIFKERGPASYEQDNSIAEKIVKSGENRLQEGQKQGESFLPSSDGLPGNVATDELEQTWEVLGRDFESWGRTLDLLVAKHSEILLKSLDNLDRQAGSKGGDNNYTARRYRRWKLNSNVSRSSTGSKKHSNDDTFNRFSYFEDTPFSRRTIQFSMITPPWTAKLARRIEFWSDFTEKRQVTNGLSPEVLFPAQKVYKDMANFSQSYFCEDSSSSPNEALTKFKRTISQNWLVSYFEDLSLRLRKGGWREDEIEDVLEISSSGPSTCNFSGRFCSDKESVLDDLSKQAEILASSLREAGWGTRDVAELLSVNLTFGGHYNRCQLHL